jgi:hypothetical protein
MYGPMCVKRGLSASQLFRRLWQCPQSCASHWILEPSQVCPVREEVPVLREAEEVEGDEEVVGAQWMAPRSPGLGLLN